MPLQTLHASKHHASPAHCLSTWHEWEWEAKPWHPRAGGEEPWGKPFRQALERLKPVVQMDYYLAARWVDEVQLRGESPGCRKIKLI